MAEDVRIDRRGFLVGAAVAASSVAVAARCDSETPVDEHTLEMERIAREEGFEEAARLSCPGVQDASLGPVDEGTEIVLGLLWSIYARVVQPDATDIDFAAIEWARSQERGWIREEIESIGLRQFMYASFGDYRRRWKDMAGEAVQHRTGSTITRAAFRRGWDAFPKTGKSAPLTDQDDETAEKIGSHLWFRFMVGVYSRNRRMRFHRAIIDCGRLHSRYYVKGNVQTMVPWPKDEVGQCAYRAGRAAALRAELDGTIHESHFHRAWCQTHEAGKRLAKKKGLDFTMMSGACA